MFQQPATLNVNFISYLVVGCWSNWIKLIIAISKRIQIVKHFEWTLNCEWNFNFLPWAGRALFSMEFLIAVSHQLYNVIEQFSDECIQPFICSLLLLLSLWKWKNSFHSKTENEPVEMRSEFILRYDWNDHTFSPFKVQTWYCKKQTDRYILFRRHDSTITTTTDTEEHSIQYFFFYVLCFVNDI